MSKLLIVLLFLSLHTFAKNINENDFKSYISTVKTKAIAKNISTQTLQILDTITPNMRVLELDNSQAEFSLNFWQYINSRVSPSRVMLGKIKITQDTTLFQEVHKKYGVPKHILIAFWGLESNFGVNTGSFNLVEALTTLAYDKRRRNFFENQLLTTLQLIDIGKLKKHTNSSWAGAMGSVQFMPNNVAKYGLDADNDGVINLWDSKEDIFHSAANFLTHIGWNKGERWGREVVLPKEFNYSLASLAIKKNLEEWSNLGIRDSHKQILPNSTLKASLVLPMGYKGPAFLVYRNFHAILNWNRSILYALSVGILADKLINKHLVSTYINEEKISKDDVIFIQQTLVNSGFNIGGIDGIGGTKTRSAIRQYQLKHNLEADGYIGQDLLRYMKKM